MSDTPAQDCFEKPCKHCGSTKGFWFSRSEPMGYFCEECGMPDKEELLEQPAKMNEIKEKEEDMSELFKLKPCEECNGTGIALIEKHDCDCPDCLGTGFEEPAKRIMNLERELNAVTEQRDGLRSGIDYASDQLHKVTEQRDRLAEALEQILEYQGRFAEEDPESIAREALQSLKQPKKYDANEHQSFYP